MCRKIILIAFLFYSINLSSQYIDVNCAQGNSFRPAQRAVGIFTSNILERNGCTGTLINNLNNDGKPIVITADHCNINVGNYFCFNYESTSCNSAETQFDQCVKVTNILSEWSVTDMKLVRLEKFPPSFKNQFLAGWDLRVDRGEDWILTDSDNPALGPPYVGIHHPKGLPKKISINDERPPLNDNLISSLLYGSLPKNNYWISDFDDGKVNNGSSGSALFNKQQRIIGQLRGALGEECVVSDKAYYGAIHKSWNGGGTNASRLRDDLDPNSYNIATGWAPFVGTTYGTRASYLNGINIPITYNEFDLEPNAIKTEEVFGTWDFGADYTWNNPRLIGDITGDGKDEIVGFHDNKVQIGYIFPNNFLAVDDNITEFSENNGGWHKSLHPRHLVDVNGDGKDDIVGFASAGVRVALSNGNGFHDSQIWFNGIGYNSGYRVGVHPRLFGDFNNDGMNDIIAFANQVTAVWTSDGDSFNRETDFDLNHFHREQGWAPAINPLTNQPNLNGNFYPRLIGDVDGDGFKDDIVGFGPNAVQVVRSNGNSFSAVETWTTQFTLNNGGWSHKYHPRRLADMNNDGKDDIVGFAASGIVVALSNGNGFDPGVLWVKGFGYGNGWRNGLHPRLIEDINGDGFKDIVGFANAGIVTSISTGGCLQPGQLIVNKFGRSHGWSSPSFVRTIGDFDGNGAYDIVAMGCDGTYIYYNEKIDLQESSNLFSGITDLQGDGLNIQNYDTHLGDITGDAKEDIVYMLQNSQNRLELRSKISNGDGTYSKVNTDYGDGSAIHNIPSIMLDHNGDGMKDIVFFFQPSDQELQIRTKISNGNGTFTSELFSVASGPENHENAKYIGDFNGDAKEDILIVFEQSDHYFFRTFFSDGNGSYTLVNNGASVISDLNLPLNITDFNLDGKDDIIAHQWWQNALYLLTFESDGNGNYQARLFDDEQIGDSFRTELLTADLNSDERKDLLIVGNNWDGQSGGLFIRSYIPQSDGSFSIVHSEEGDIGLSDSQIFVGDFNGDRSEDLIFIDSHCEVEAVIKYSLGDGTFCSDRVTLGDGVFILDNEIFVGDISGDLIDDLLFSGNDWEGSGTGLAIKTKISNGTMKCGSSFSDCSGALEITWGYDCSDKNIVASNIGTSPSSHESSFDCGDIGEGNDVWFTMPIELENLFGLTLETIQLPGGLTDMVMEVYKGTCGSLEEIACDDDSGEGNQAKIEFTVNEFEIGDILFIRVYDYASNDSGLFGLCAHSPLIIFSSNACFPENPNSNEEWIQKIEIDTFISNSGNDQGYANFLSKEITLLNGNSYPIKLVPGFASDLYNEYWKIWIDFNNDGTGDADELLFSSQTASPDSLLGNIEIPNNIEEGSYIMRVSMKYVDNDNDPAIQEFCSDFTFGEIEDYLVNIIDINIDHDGDGYILADDCNDYNSNISPGSLENPYNAVDDDCNPETPDDDLDQDGFFLVDDCNDQDAFVNSNAVEIPYNGIDDDCNSLTLDDDLDQDGFLLEDDCEDEIYEINPDAEDICDGIDNNCDGIIDENNVYHYPPQITCNLLDQSSIVLDWDSNPNIISYDIYMDGELQVTTNDSVFLVEDLNLLDTIDFVIVAHFSNSCTSLSTSIECTPNVDQDGDGFGIAEDCDDNNANINPDQTEEVYNGLDDDCNPETLDDDLDQDGFLLEDDCDDFDSNINPSAEDIPDNGIDEDCNGVDSVTTTSINVLEELGIKFYPNPVTTNLFIQAETDYSVHIYNTYGALIYENKNPKIVIMQEYTNGLYLVLFTDHISKKSAMARIIVSK